VQLLSLWHVKALLRGLLGGLLAGLLTGLCFGLLESVEYSNF